MMPDFMKLVSDFAQSNDDENPLSRLSELLDAEGKEQFARELHAISALDERRS